MLNDHDIARWRMHTQGLVEPHRPTAVDVVRSLLAVQAENPSQSAWAVAARTVAPDPADLAGLLDDGAVLRTHVLRPTWHYVAADDLPWLLELTGPRVRRTIQLQLHAAHEMDGLAIDRASSAVIDALADGELTRGELAGALAGRGEDIARPALVLLLADLELQALVCSGRPAADGTHTYARLTDRIRAPRALDRPEALAVLAWRYFTGHGPATERDLAYWATLPLGDVRAGLAQASDRLSSFEHDGRTFWHSPGDAPTDMGRPAGHLLQILDESYRGYQESRWVLDAACIVPRSRERTTGMALVDAQVVASMKRTVAPDRVVFELRPYRPLAATDVAAVDEAAARYGAFLGRRAVLDVR